MPRLILRRKSSVIRRPANDAIARRIDAIANILLSLTEDTVALGEELNNAGKVLCGSLDLPREMMDDLLIMVAHVRTIHIGSEMADAVAEIHYRVSGMARIINYERGLCDKRDAALTPIYNRAMNDVMSLLRLLLSHLDFFVGDPKSYAAPGVSKREARWTKASLDVASWIARGARPQARAEWIAELSAAQHGEVQTTAKRLRFTIDLLRAAVRIRWAYASAPCAAFIDRVACSERLTWRCVSGVVFVLSLYVFRVEGLTGVISDGDSLFSFGGGVYGIMRWRRKVVKDREEILPAPTEDKE